VLNVAKYKIYIIIGVACFVIGYCLCLLSSRGQLQAVRIRADQVDANNRQLREQLESSQKQLAKLKATITAAGKTVDRAANAASDIEKSNRGIGKSIDTAIEKIESSGDELKDARRILQTVQKRGRIKD
jgi:septal ring factor EnvC (AmiA/AmiB activator)